MGYSSYSLASVSVLSAIGAFLLLRWADRARRVGKAVPGPKGWPIVGNAFDFPSRDRWKIFAKWRREYGDVFGLNLFGTPLIVLNSAKAIEDLLDQRSATTSDRPIFTLMTSWGGANWPMFFLQQGEAWQRQRRLFHQALGPKMSKDYETVLQGYAIENAAELVKRPDDFGSCIDLLVTRIIQHIAYGYRVEDMDDYWVQTQRHFVTCTMKLPGLGTHLVDIFPFLRHFPQILFGRDLKYNLQVRKSYASTLLSKPFAEAQKRAVDDVILKPSIPEWAISEYTQPDGSLKYEYELKAVTAVCFNAGNDTMSQTISSTIIMMMCNPEAQREAQQAIDLVVGQKHLPTWKDREHLPIVNAIILETMRHVTATPYAISHRTANAQIYEGMYIPANSTLLPNVWGVLHDPSNYEDPHTYNPYRFLTDDHKSLREDVLDPTKHVFGYGRRVCPGRHLADLAVWINVVTILALFDISKPLDKDGKVIEPKLEYETAAIGGRLKPQKARFRLRSIAAKELLESLTA